MTRGHGLAYPNTRIFFFWSFHLIFKGNDTSSFLIIGKWTLRDFQSWDFQSQDVDT